MDVAWLRILVPVLGRPHRVEPLIESAIAATPGLSLEQIYFIADPGDASEIRTIEAMGAPLLKVAANYPRKVNVAAKVAADNRAGLLFIGADDLDFKPGWYEAAVAHMRHPIRVVGVNDDIDRRGGKQNHATHFLIDATYLFEGTIDGVGPGLLHEGYDHCFTDNEFIGTAKARGVYRYAEDSHVEHLHPLARKAETDPTYQRGMRRFAEDQALFYQREALWA